MILVQKLNKKYKEKVIFEDFNLKISDNEFVVITGKSGKGKTTLLNMLGLIEKYDAGSIHIDGNEIRNKLPFFRKQAGFVFQNYALIEEISVEKNLLLALEYEKQSKKIKLEKISDVLKQVELEGYEKNKIYNLSGGEQQRVALARIILKNPKYIFADEPTGNLDLQNKKLVFSILEKLNKSGKTVVVVSHDVEITKFDFITNHINLDLLNC